MSNCVKLGHSDDKIKLSHSSLLVFLLAHFTSVVKAKFHYASWFAAGLELVRSWFELKFGLSSSSLAANQHELAGWRPNSITLSGSKLVRTSQRNGIWLLVCSRLPSARLFLKGPQLARYALGHICLLTGHISLNRHLDVMKIQTDPICSACGQEDETSLHILGKCPTTMITRHSFLGSHSLRSDELCCIKPHTLMRFVRASKRFT